MTRALSVISPPVWVVVAAMAAAPLLLVATEDKHDHPDKGPHGGALVELGDEEYHAEFIHDEKAASVIVFILDGAAKKLVPIEAKEAHIYLKSGAEPRRYALKASPLESDVKGKASRFTSGDKILLARLHDEDTDARLQVTIAGSPYSGRIVHDHDHEK